MKICVTSTGPSMDAPVDPRFGRCQYFMIVGSETMEYEAMPNPSVGASGVQEYRRHRLLQARASASLEVSSSGTQVAASPTGSHRGGGMGRDKKRYGRV